MAPRSTSFFSRRPLFRWFVPAVAIGALAIPTVVAAQVDPLPEPPTSTTSVPLVPPGVIGGGSPATIAPVVLTTTTEVPTTTDAPTTTEGPTTTTIDPNEPTTTTIDPNAPTTTTTIPPVVDVIGEEVEIDDQPPPFKPILPPSLIIAPRNITLEKALAKLSEQQKKIVDEAQKQADAATERIAAAQKELDVLQIREEELKAQGVKLAQAKEGTAIKIRARALRIYAGESVADLDSLLRSQDANEFARNVDLIGAAQQRDAELLAQFKDDERKLQDNLDALSALTKAKQDQIESLIVEQEVLTESLATLQEQLSFVLSGQAIALGGFVFPVGAPFNFASTFGAPRMTGTKYQHTHQGNDIFAPIGTPLYAVSRGVIARKAVAVLGGNKLWLVAADGTQYYYAHLSAYADGIEDGTVVEAGQVIGYVGDTGNAKGTPPHCHFEIHPNGGPAIDPYPILDAVRKSDAGRLLAATQAINATTTTLPPGSGNAGIGVSLEIAIGPVDASAAGPRSSTTITLPPSRN